MEKEEYYLDELWEMKRAIDSLYEFHGTYERHEIQSKIERVNIISNDLLYSLYGVKVENIYPDE